jgi:hypothetical protein
MRLPKRLSVVDLLIGDRGAARTAEPLVSLGPMSLVSCHKRGLACLQNLESGVTSQFARGNEKGPKRGLQAAGQGLEP